MGLDLLLGSFPQHAQVAQLVEHATENRSVGGSIPPLGTITLDATGSQQSLHAGACPGVARRAKPDGSIPPLATKQNN